MAMQHFNEHALEMSIMELFQQEGYIYTNGEEIHKEVGDVLLRDDLRAYLREHYAEQGLTVLEVDSVIAKLTANVGGSLYENNVHTYRLITEGFSIKREDASLADLYIEPIDFTVESNNIIRIVNQLAIKGAEKRIPDGIVYINGLPMVVLEFKSAVKENTTIKDAFTQLTVRYRRDIPELFKYNAFVVISDGVNSKYGSLFTPYEFFYAWRKVEAGDKATDGVSSLLTMVQGLFRKERLLSVIKDFVFLPDSSKKEQKIVCRYPQFFATHKLFNNIRQHSKLNADGDGKGGTYFGATGCGKSFTMLFLTRMLMRSREFASPTILLITDRTDLDTQLSEQFGTAKKFIGDECVVEVESRAKLREYLEGRTSGGVFLTTIHKFTEDIQLLSKRANIICISDEAHRSVFGKYTAIFDYFDCLLVGLTATPRDEVERNTFELFCIDEQDTFAYELGEAVADRYLVPYNGLKRGTNILAEGIKYDRLSKEEKEQLEEVWIYEKAKKAINTYDVTGIAAEAGEDYGEKTKVQKYVRNIESSEIFRYIFNVDTVDKVLQDLMLNGLTVQNGERIGKTIIFAYNHDHAELVVQRFNALFPHLGSDFCVLIDNRVTYAQDLINKFEVRDGMPQIAVSVDMLDTGIDVPDILNLVFFKPVHSKIKFWQMIGRGTRLSENIFGVDKHKEYFNIFDWCNNFEFFSQNPDGKEALPVQSLTERLFCVRTDIAVALQHADYQSLAFAKDLHGRLKTELRSQVAELQDTHISVRQHWETVDKFRKEASWVYISSVDAVLLKEEVAPLISKSLLDEKAKLFDLLMYSIELSLLVPEVNSARSQRKVVDISLLLQERASIPQVAAKMPIIKSLTEQTFWENLQLNTLEHVREELRDIIKFIVGGANRKFTIDIEDTVIDKGTAEILLPRTYKQKVVDYLAENSKHPAIQKIINLEQLTREDIVELERIMWKELGSKEEYQKYVASGNMLCGDSVAAFVRAQVGVDRVKALEAFSSFLGDNVLNSMQEEYLKTIITYVCSNGDITPATLLTKAPFDAYQWQAVFGPNLVCVKQFVDKLHNCIVA